MRLTLAFVALAVAACTATTEAAPLPECAAPFQGTWTMTETRAGAASTIAPCSTFPASGDTTFRVTGSTWEEQHDDGSWSVVGAIRYSRTTSANVCTLEWGDTKNGIRGFRTIYTAGKDTERAQTLFGETELGAEDKSCTSRFNLKTK